MVIRIFDVDGWASLPLRGCRIGARCLHLRRVLHRGVLAVQLLVGKAW
jgi:hypothetical protein